MYRVKRIFGAVIQHKIKHTMTNTKIKGFFIFRKSHVKIFLSSLSINLNVLI